MKGNLPLAALLLLCSFAACCRSRAVLDERMLGDERDGTDWPSYGRTYSESHYSPLSEIDRESVKRLGLAWSLDLDVTNSITCPLEVGGVLYFAAGYSIVHAVDARTGRLLWRFDPRAPEVAGATLRVGWGIRGLAYSKGSLFVGTQDGRLISLNAATAQVRWSVQTVNPKSGMFISGAPRVFNGKVVIGNAGGDFSPQRGYVTAYDTADGRQLWRFYVVPGRPGVSDGAASDEVMGMAAKTWTGTRYQRGAGGNVWSAITYDPEYNRVYIGTGNGDPMNWKLRSPGGGDNLFISSIVALDAETGKYIWHYQTTPGDTWDYDSATDMTLADLPIDGKVRKVILHAPKNGFFYVIDREHGKLISAEKLGKVTWAERVNLESGRPVENPAARFRDKEALVWPSFQGMHHWLPQSFSPLTGLVYEPTLDLPAMYSDKGVKLADWHPILYTPAYSGLTLGDSDVPRDAGTSVLRAWNPVTQKLAWEVRTNGISNGGTLSTAGNLVFQGLADGYLHAYAADTGKDLWSFFAGTAVTGVPISYAVDGRQYISITAGPLNGAPAGFGSLSARWGWDARIHPKRLLTFVLDGRAELPPTAPPQTAAPLAGPDFALDEQKARSGADVYTRCALCHGPGVVAGGTAPDLRASTIPLSKPAFTAVVREGGLVSKGMPQFAELSDDELESLRHFIRAKARGVSYVREPPLTAPAVNAK